VRLPKELRPEVREVQIKLSGDRWIVSPIRAVSWLDDFFSKIRREDSTSFQRPLQGEHREIQL